MNISESEILDAIREAVQQPSVRIEGALTRAELCEALGMGPSTMMKRIVALVKSGGMECVWIATTDVTGRANRTPAYRLVAPSSKKKAKR